MRTLIISAIILLITYNAQSQSEDYDSIKQQKLVVKSPFERIIERELPATIEYEDDEIIAFIPLRSQAPVHVLIVPKKRIYTLNDIQEEDALLLGRMMIVAKNLASAKGISKSGYRLIFNTNEDSGQSVFHIHLHLIGGKKLGPMTTQDYTDPEHRE